MNSDIKLARIRMESPGAVKSPGRENAQTQEITVKDCINKP